LTSSFLRYCRSSSGLANNTSSWAMT